MYTPVTQRRGAHLLLISLTLVGLGIVMVYSSSSVLASVRFADSGFFLERQAVRALIGLGLMLLLSRIHPSAWARSARALLVGSVVLLVLVLAMGHGRAGRWLSLSMVAFQPSEFAKLALVVYLADVLARKEACMHDLRDGLLPRLLVVGTVLVLVAAQPNLGTAVALGLISLVLLWVGGARLKHLALTMAAASPLVVLSLVVSPYQQQRVLRYIDRFTGGSSDSYQVDQALVALGSGGWLGLGLGNSLQKQQYLPEPHTDFVFALVGEELGLVGTLSVIALFVAFACYGLRVAREAPTYHGSLLATGITAMISTYALLNVGVATSVLPTTGLPLPFI
ncbi:MAG: FtsW/RodA/SpoVE family cell cycle protein, partial [Candidatus Latescibacterota bacterium]